jgi:prepilin-type N-terminal cleavage/methylation domain-containing protein
MTRRRNKAFALPELLMALVILAVLLAAVAAAVHASLHNHQENQEAADVAQTIRFIFDRISREVRTAAAVNAVSNTLTILPPAGGDVTQTKYQYASGRLYYYRTDGTGTHAHVLLESTDVVVLTGFSVTPQYGEDWEGTPCTKSVRIRIDFQVDGRSQAVVASAAPRRNQLY